MLIGDRKISHCQPEVKHLVYHHAVYPDETQKMRKKIGKGYKSMRKCFNFKRKPYKRVSKIEHENEKKKKRDTMADVSLQWSKLLFLNHCKASLNTMSSTSKGGSVADEIAIRNKRN